MITATKSWNLLLLGKTLKLKMCNIMIHHIPIFKIKVTIHNNKKMGQKKSSTASSVQELPNKM